MIKSKLTTKAQTTIPRPVRDALRLEVGDEIAYQIQGDRVMLTRASSSAVDDPFATFGEWETEADRKASWCSSSSGRGGAPGSGEPRSSHPSAPSTAP